MRITANLLTWPLVIVSVASHGQQTSRYSVGINLGTFIYNGDLNPSRTGSWKTPGFVWGLTGHRTLSSTIAARLELNFGKLRGDEARYSTPEYRQYRAFAFSSNVTEVVVAAEYSPLGNARRLSPYAFGGIGYTGMRITRDYSRFNAAYFINEPLLKEGLVQDIAVSPPTNVAVFPLGLGLKYAISRKFSLHGEAAHRFTRSDYIDGFSKSANPDFKDSYTKYSLGVRLSLGNTDPYACPKIRY